MYKLLRKLIALISKVEEMLENHTPDSEILEVLFTKLVEIVSEYYER